MKTTIIALTAFLLGLMAFDLVPQAQHTARGIAFLASGKAQFPIDHVELYDILVGL